VFELHEAEIISRLREPSGDGGDLIDQLEVWTEAVRTREDAARIIAELPASWVRTARRRLGRNTGRGGRSSRSPRRGERAKHQPDFMNKAGPIPSRPGCR
jgi:hypothetical protein